MSTRRDDGRDLVGIGEFSALTGVTISTLRHHHQAGLLVPGEVDPWTGYRRYRRDQARTARVIRALRALEMPLEDIGCLLGADEAAARRIWAAHRARLRERVERIQGGLALIDEALSGERGPALDAIADRMNEEAETMVETTTTCRLMGVTLRVPDVEAAARFYQQVFGIGFEPEAHPGGPRHFHACGGTWKPQEFFLFTLWPGDEAERRASVDFTVDDVDATWRRALEAGATALMAPYDSGEYPRHACFADPFGHQVGVYAG